jgi:hypothetical protein
MTTSDSISQVIEKFDSCWSRKMSEIKKRLLTDSPMNDKIITRGFNNNTSEVNSIRRMRILSQC